MAMRVATTDFKKALSSEPWFCCQALAGVARFAPDSEVVRLAEEAIAVAFTATDSYKRVAVIAWPLRALIERGQSQKATHFVPEILSLAACIENPVSRSDALLLLWQAFFPTQGHKAIFDDLIKSCARHWKADYILRQIALIVASEDVGAAQLLVASVPPGKYKRQAEKRLAEGQKESPRSFF